MSKDLSPKERAVLLTLLLHGPTLSNSKSETVRLDVSPRERERLNTLGLVSSVKKVAYSHTLTDTGRKWCLRDIATGVSRPGDSALERAFYSALTVVRTKVDFESLFGGDLRLPPEPTGGADVEAAIRAAYKKVRRQPGALVSLADLRENLDSVPRVDLDAALGRLITQPGVVLIPESNQASLTARHRAAAVKLGGQLKHHIKIDHA